MDVFSSGHGSWNTAGLEMVGNVILFVGICFITKFWFLYRIIASIKEKLPKVDADVGVNGNDVDRNDASLDGQTSDSETGEEGQQKKKLKKEKVGFRDRKV